jgi:hypothetical protein
VEYFKAQGKLYLRVQSLSSLFDDDIHEREDLKNISDQITSKEDII